MSGAEPGAGPAAAPRGGWTLARAASGYPEGLDDLGSGAPKALHGVGRREAIEGLRADAAVTIVGARRASRYGLELAERLAADLARAGVTVVSGLAIGIDAAAHRGALDGGGATIAVLAGGPDVVYPARHRGLYRAVLEHGAAVSELAPGTRPHKGDFPARNRIMAALAKVVVIVEAAAPSGSLITAARAHELGRELGAVPGQVGSRAAAGTNSLIKESCAHLIRDAQDVLDLLAGVGATAARVSGPPLEPDHARVLDALERGAGSPDLIAAMSAVEPASIGVALARLERLGYLAADGLGGHVRTGLAAPRQ